jgi:hypothetical protein
MAHRRFGRSTTGWKGSAGSVAAGVGTGFALPYVASAVPQLSTWGWWAMPTAMIALGHFLKKKYPTIGGALLGIGGLQAYNAYLGSRGAKGYPTDFDAGSTNYNDNNRTDSAPSMNTAQAAALLNASPSQVMGYAEAAFAEAGADEAYGLVD